MGGCFKKIFLIPVVILFLPLIFSFIEICPDIIVSKIFPQKLFLSSLYASDDKPAGERGAVYSEVEENGDISHGENPFSFKPDGFIEIENYYSSDKKKTSRERNLKNEFRANLELKAGWENLFLYSKTNFYYIPQLKKESEGENYYYLKDSNVSDNLIISDKEYEMEFSELYLNFSNSFLRVRAGNQVYSWGTADLHNPTSYFNPADYREYVFADEDELRLAVPSGSVMIFAGSATVEMVFVPVHISSRVPADGNYWQIRSESSAIDLHMQRNKGLSKKLSNSAYGIRTAFSPRGVDVSLSYYHGPDKNPVFVPEYINFFEAPPVLEIAPEYFIVNKIGFDLSTQISDFVIQCEAVYSPDKTWLVERDMYQFITANMTGRSSYQTSKSHYVLYAAGFNYYMPVNKFIRDYGGESIITLEWQQPWYSDEKVMEPLVSKIILLRFEEICFDSRIKISISYLNEMNKNAHVVKPEIKYDFQNGVSMKFSYLYIKAESDAMTILPNEDTSLLYYMRDKDMGTFSVRYDF